MFRGYNAVSIDAKGRLAVPARFRELLGAAGVGTLVMTISPWDRCLWLYPLPEWEALDSQLQALPSADTVARMTKRVVLGHATDCPLDGQGRILMPHELQELVGIDRRIVVMGQGNKLELWDEATWKTQRTEYLQEVAAGTTPTSELLKTLSL